MIISPILRTLRRSLRWFMQIVLSAIIVAILIFIVLNFYIFSSIVNLNSFFYAFLLLSFLTDGLFIFIHLPRRLHRKRRTYFDPSKVTVVIPCYNGEDIIAETIRSAAVHVPRKQIIVVDDTSTDRTGEIARKEGVQVITNTVNLNKVRNINKAMQYVKTPYVLILDDDTLIGDSFIPTSLLDDGYTAVAFNVMPIKERTLINELQQFEYRNTMQISKNLRAVTGSIGNISGAIGLYRSEDLRQQITLHSGQFAGEDEQRTLLAHMYGTGKGITYIDSLVLTKAPDTYRDLFRQRAFSWSLASPELFTLYWRVILSTRHHYLLKTEKAYYVYMFLTEPLRILFCWTLIMRPSHIATAYVFYTSLNLLIWLRLGHKDTLRSVFLSPIYTLGLTVCRFIGYFYWLKVKANYLSKRLHRSIKGRKLLAEYAVVFMIIIASWVISVQHFRNDMHLFNKIRSDNLTSNENAFNYASTSLNDSLAVGVTDSNDSVTVFVEQGDNMRAVAHKAIDKWLLEQGTRQIDGTNRWNADMWLAGHLPSTILNQPNTPLPVSRTLIKQAVSQSTTNAKN